jgi:pimeloyl-ACP methyl ester carboxylesterase
LDALGVERVNVMGSSGGSAFALAFALHQPSCTKSLVLLCPQLHRWDAVEWLPINSRWTLPLLKRPLFRQALLILYRLQLPRMRVDQFLKMEAGDRYLDVKNDTATKRLCESSLTAMCSGIRHPGFENDIRIFAEEEIMDGSRTLHSPTMVLYDKSDPMAPAAHVDWLVSLVSHCVCVEVRTAGHLIWVGPDADLAHQSRVQFLQTHG